MRASLIVLLAFAQTLSAQTLSAQAAHVSYVPANYVQSTHDIPMRDGVTLHLEIFSPPNASEALPFLLQRTPYGVGASRGRVLGSYKELAQDGYHFVFQDIRGRYKSNGTFVMQRPPRLFDGPKDAIDESTDTFDTIDWLLKNIPHNNGRVGMLGVSYDGWTAAMAMLDPHPALKAVSPQASPADMFIGDDFHHNGAFRLSYGFEYAFLTEASKENGNFTFDKYDTYDWYLALGPLSNVQSRYLKDKCCRPGETLRNTPTTTGSGSGRR